MGEIDAWDQKGEKGKNKRELKLEKPETKKPQAKKMTDDAGADIALMLTSCPRSP